MKTFAAVATSTARVVLLVGRARLTDEAGEVPTAAQESTYADSGPLLDDPVEFFVYTHCGVESLRLDGRWWVAVDHLYYPSGPGGPPDGWGDPYAKVQLTMDSAEHVSFEAQGTTVAFVPARDNEPVRVCR